MSADYCLPGLVTSFGVPHMTEVPQRPRHKVPGWSGKVCALSSRLLNSRLLHVFAPGYMSKLSSSSWTLRPLVNHTILPLHPLPLYVLQCRLESHRCVEMNYGTVAMRGDARALMFTHAALAIDSDFTASLKGRKKSARSFSWLKGCEIACAVHDRAELLARILNPPQIHFSTFLLSFLHPLRQLSTICRALLAYIYHNRFF